jgi:hypothetical protein
MNRRVILFISLLLTVGISGAAAQQREGRASFRFKETSLRASLDSLMRWFPVSIVYLDRDVEGKSVSAGCEECDFEGALSSVLEGTSLTWIRMGNQVVLKVRDVQKPGPVGTVSGVVMDSLTGGWLAGATVLLQDSLSQTRLSVRRWCPTNVSGFYALRGVAPGSYLLVVRALGYRVAVIPTVVAGGQSLRQDVGLVEANITMQEVTVEGHATALRSAEGFSRGLYIRSTPSDQTEYLLDGARIYNPSHFGGVLSTFNAEVMNDVQVMVGGLPPYYGGRIGGILDLSMRDGTSDRLSGSAGAGSLGAHISLEGPVGAGTTFLISGRRGYPDPPVPHLQDYGTPSRLGLSEVTAKLTHRLAPGDQLFVNCYIGRDAYDNLVNGNGTKLSNNFSWGNSTVNLGWTAIASSSVFLRASALYTRYDFSLQHILTDSLQHILMEASPLPLGTPLSSDYAIEDIGLRAHAEHYYDQEHTLRGGVELVHHRTQGNISEFSTRIGRKSLDGFSSWELSIYLQDQWRILPRVMAEIGARATSFTGSEGTFSSIDPRFSLLVSLSERVRMYGSLTTINQFLHPYRNSGVFLFYPTIFWYPSTEKIKPSTSLQVTLGVDAGDDTFVASAESFYRTTSNLHGFGIDTVTVQTSELDNAILYGTGRSYGVEFALHKRTGDLTGSVSYTLSWVTEQFAEINGGNPFSARLDRRHELQVSASYTPAENWIFGAVAVVASGENPASFETPLINGDRNFSPALAIPDVNGSRLPGFQRLELSATRVFSLSGVQCLLSFRLLNAYGLVDPFSWGLRNVSDPRLMWTASLDELKLLPLFPTLGILVRF